MELCVRTSTIDRAVFPNAGQLREWQSATDSFDDGFRPTGSAAHEAYTNWLADRFSEAGATVAYEAYSFQKWTPTACTLELTGGADREAVPLSAYIPYSGQTDPAGIAAAMVYVSPVASEIEEWFGHQTSLTDVIANRTTLVAQLTALFAAAEVTGKIVLVDIPRIPMPIAVLAPQTYYKNDPRKAFGRGAAIDQSGSLIDMIAAVPAIQAALAAAHALGMVAVLDFPEPLARGAYYSFNGVENQNLPGVYLNREVGARLRNAILANGGNVDATLVLDAARRPAMSNHVIACVPGIAGSSEIVIGSHTDGTNSIEDNGPAAMLAMAHYFCSIPQADRPLSLRFLLTSGHFIGSLGLTSYLAKHSYDLSCVRAIIEIEHLGAREWAEVTPGEMRLTGKVEPQLLLTNSDPGFVSGWDAAQPAALLNRSIDLSKKLPTSLVAGPATIGEGLWFHRPDLVVPGLRPYPSIQFITVPAYLLCAGMREVTTEFTDYDLMRDQAIGLAQMAVDLAGSRWE